MRFRDREHAALLLLERLKKYKGKNPLVLGIPRGAMPMAKIIAEGLQGELSAILVHKIPHPENEEFAIGSIGLSGHIELLTYAESYSIPKSYIKAAATLQLEILRARQKRYGIREPDYRQRIVIIVDDGIATGATTIAAIDEVKVHKPEKIIVAAAVASRNSAEKIQPNVDEWVVLDIPEPFYAVGQFFEDFSEVSDEEVIRTLGSMRS